MTLHCSGRNFIKAAPVSNAADVGAQGIGVFPNAVPEEGDETGEKILEQIGKSLSELAIVGHNPGVQVRLKEHGYSAENIPVIKKILDYLTV